MLTFICKVDGCNKRFYKSCNLKDHFRTHDKKKPSVCHLCGMTYSQIGNLKKHHIREHPRVEWDPQLARDYSK